MMPTVTKIVVRSPLCKHNGQIEVEISGAVEAVLVRWWCRCCKRLHQMKV